MVIKSAQREKEGSSELLEFSLIGASVGFVIGAQRGYRSGLDRARLLLKEQEEVASILDDQQQSRRHFLQQRNRILAQAMSRNALRYGLACAAVGCSIGSIELILRRLRSGTDDVINGTIAGASTGLFAGLLIQTRHFSPSSSSSSLVTLARNLPPRVILAWTTFGAVSGGLGWSMRSMSNQFDERRKQLVRKEAEARRGVETSTDDPLGQFIKSHNFEQDQDEKSNK